MAYPGVTPLVITGMHRSATSLVASLFHDSGIQMGTRLLAQGKGNPRGFFEDEDFHAFHEKALRDRGHSAFVDASFAFDPTLEETANACALIEARQPLALWGWKDPRTTLFLDFWASLLPDAAFLLLYRHPIDVLASLLRRLEPMGDWAEGLDVWQTYNERLLTFRQGGRSRSLLCHGYATLDQPETVRRAVSEKLGPRFAITPKAQETRYHPGELRRLALPPELLSGFSRLYPATQALYEKLQAEGDVPDQHARSNSDAPAAFAPFLQFVAAIPPGQEAGLAQAGLHALMTCVDDQMVEAASREARRSVEEYRIGLTWLQEQRATLQAENQRIAQILAEQRAWIEELERGKAVLTAELERLTSRADELQAANLGLAHQVADLQRRLADQQGRIDEAQQALAAIRASTRWRATGPIWRLAEMLAPRDSRRAAFLASSIRKLTGRR